MGRAAGWLPGAGGMASALQPLVLLLPQLGACGEPFGGLASWEGSIPSTPLPLALLGGSRGLCSPGLLLAGATISPNPWLPALCPPEEMLRPADFPPLPCPLCRSFLRAFLRVNQGENCSRSCLEATRG